MSINLEDALEINLQQLQAGTSLEGVLAACGDQAAELEPLLTTAAVMADLAAEAKISPAAQTHSRVQFLAAVTPLPAAPRQNWFPWFHFRLAASSLVLAGIFALGLLGTGLASAAALPGDIFYPVKRMVENIQVNLAPDSTSRLELEENLDGRRLHEAARLSEISRREFVTFSGVLTQSGDGRWMVGDLLLVFSADLPPLQMLDRYVQVSGYSDTHQVDVAEIQLRSFTWDGLIQKIGADSWQVGGIWVTLDPDTRLSGAAPQVGAAAHIVAMRLADNRYTALVVDVSPLPTATATRVVKVRASATTVPSQVVTPKATEKEREEVKKTERPEASRTATPQTQKRSPTPTLRTTTRSPEQKGTTTQAPRATRTPTHSSSDDGDDND